VFYDNVNFESVNFKNVVMFEGRKNLVLFDRFSTIDSEKVELLEKYGFFVPDSEITLIRNGKRVSKYVMYNNINSIQKCREKLDSFDMKLSDKEKDILCKSWEEGARRMFTENTDVTFRGAEFDNLDLVTMSSIDFYTIQLNTSIAGSPETQSKFHSLCIGTMYDIFISHASEDKDMIVRPLAEVLRNMGYMVWYDEHTLHAADSLIDKIDWGLNSSRAAVVVASHNYFRKEWTMKELNKLLQQKTGTGKKLFPVLYDLTIYQLKEYCYELSDLIALEIKNDSIEKTAHEISENLK
jgi:hypothetical protein